MSEPENHIEPAPIPEIELQRYLDGRLSPDAQRSFDEKLKAHPAARRTADAMREEARLLREGLESLSEPPYKIADKVMAGIYEDYRKRTAAIRARRMRNRFLVTLSAAAMLMLAVYFVRPRDPAGALASGNHAGILQANGKVETLAKGGKIYEGDVLVTARGEFVRLRLADGSALDLDESSRLRIEQVRNRTTSLMLESGRMGIVVGAESMGFSIKLPAGHLQAEPGAQLDVWLPAPNAAIMPQGLGAWTAHPPESKTGVAGQACLTVREGTAYIVTTEYPRGLAVAHARRVCFGPGISANTGVAFTVPQALDSRNEAWAASEGAGPQDRCVLGLFAPFDFSDLGHRFGLTEQLPGGEVSNKAMQAALTQLTDANNMLDPVARATRLSQGQQGLREVTQGFPLIYEGRRRARVLEGLAHYERGRVLLAQDTPQSRSGAEAAFLASSVAFQEALVGDQDENAQLRMTGLTELKLAPKVAANSRLKDFSADESALLLAQFYRPWALYHLHELNAGAGGEDLNIPALFEGACDAMGRSAESLAARYGKAKALQQAQRGKEALSTLEELSISSVAGVNDDARALTEGLRQTAHVERARIAAAANDLAGLNTVSEEFRMRYPLEAESAAGREIRAIQNAVLLKSGEKALNEHRFEEAVNAYATVYGRAGSVETLPAAERYQAQVNYLEALIGKNDGEGAAQAAKELSKLKAPEQSDIERTRVEALIEKANRMNEAKK